MTDPIWKRFEVFDFSQVTTPIHLIDEVCLRENLEVLRRVQQESGAKIIMALKAFAQWSVFPTMREYLPGATASSLHEARLAKEEFGGEVHLCAPAYPPHEITELIDIADHIVFNSIAQYQLCKAELTRRDKQPELGLRLNPEHSEVATKLYDPCAPRSRLGTRLADLQNEDLSWIGGLHFHSLCEMGLPPLERTLAVVEERFAFLLAQVRWVNFGGGHHITRPDYDVAGLIRLIKDFKKRHQVEVFMEPGEAAVIRTGVLVTRVLDIIHPEAPVAILDTSATAHMPDTLEMPYRPEVYGAGEPDEYAHTYRLGGLTCLAGDVIGDYSFPEPLRIGDTLTFLDMSHYTMVKNTHFNGVRPPAIAIGDSSTGLLRVVREFTYEHYRDRLS